MVLFSSDVVLKVLPAYITRDLLKEFLIEKATSFFGKRRIAILFVSTCNPTAGNPLYSCLPAFKVSIGN
jgi:hypothetical protein